MNANILYQNNLYQIDLSKPLSIALPLTPNPDAASAWYCQPTKIEPVRMGDWVGEVAQGGSVNFRNVVFNPHGNGTHTECLGHITKENHSILQCLSQFWFYARVLSVPLLRLHNGDEVLSENVVRFALRRAPAPQALVLRTLPNSDSKKTRQYSNSNPPYIPAGTMQAIVEAGIEHLLIDLPSVDREHDEGALAAHHIFWQYPQNPRTGCTITELIYVTDNIADGDYFLNLQVCAIENDAAPSMPVLYEIAGS